MREGRAMQEQLPSNLEIGSERYFHTQFPLNIPHRLPLLTLTRPYCSIYCVSRRAAGKDMREVIANMLMKKLMFVAVLWYGVNIAYADPIVFLEPKTVFCYSQQSLAKYLKLAESRNFEGLNQLVVKGKCGFVPDGDIIRLSSYRDHRIKDRPIIAFENQEQTLWTFKVLVKQVSTSNL